MIFLVLLAVLVLYSPAPAHSHIYSMACSYAAFTREITAICLQQHCCIEVSCSQKGKIMDGIKMTEQDI